MLNSFPTFKIIFLAAGVMLLAASCNQQSVNKSEQNVVEQSPSDSATGSDSTPIATQDVSFAEYNDTFQFTATIPADWQVEYVAGTDALNIFNPTANGSANLERSQIFIRHFTANSFLTLNTVDIINQEAVTLHDKPAMRYEIKKKPSVPNFPDQPLWRSQQHKLIDVRVSNSNPSIFYVIAANPRLDQAQFELFLDSLKF